MLTERGDTVTENALMAAALTHRNAARWTVALAVGLRQSEALALRWSDVDLDNGTLSVRRGLHRVSGRGLIYEEPKADRSRRNLALPTPLVQALRAHRAAQLEERIAAGSLWEDHDLVGCTTGGTRRRPCCCPRACIRGSSWRCLATHRCARRRTPTATSCRPSAGTPRTAWARRCGTDVVHCVCSGGCHAGLAAALRLADKRIRLANQASRVGELAARRS